jgi:hypothetical protein
MSTVIPRARFLRETGNIHSGNVLPSLQPKLTLMATPVQRDGKLRREIDAATLV